MGGDSLREDDRHQTEKRQEKGRGQLLLTKCLPHASTRLGMCGQYLRPSLLKRKLRLRSHCELRAKMGPALPNTKGKSVLTVLPKAAPQGGDRLDGEEHPSPGLPWDWPKADAGDYFRREA